MAYRDFGPDGETEVHPFSADVEAATRFLDRQNARVGDDEPEDIAGGLASALGLQWLSETRTLVLVADAPCHGQKYHTCTDTYPQGDPTGLSMTLLVSALRNSFIDFTVVQLSSSTYRMHRMLRRTYESAAGPGNIRKFELRDLREIIQTAGHDAIASGAPEVATMFSAAVTPTIDASYTSTTAGATSYSSSVAASYSAYSTCPGRPCAAPTPTEGRVAPGAYSL